jgi:hypothetical protein
MHDEKQVKGEPVRDVVALTQDHEVRYWTQRFGVTEFRLRTAVAAVGHSEANIAVWLKLNR